MFHESNFVMKQVTFKSNNLHHCLTLSVNYIMKNIFMVKNLFSKKLLKISYGPNRTAPQHVVNCGFKSAVINVNKVLIKWFLLCIFHESFQKWPMMRSSWWIKAKRRIMLEWRGSSMNRLSLIYKVLFSDLELGRSAAIAHVWSLTAFMSQL